MTSCTRSRRGNRQRTASSLQGMFEAESTNRADSLSADEQPEGPEDSPVGLSRKLRRMKRRLLLEAALETQGSFSSVNGWRQDSNGSLGSAMQD
mmetsp:Transcript_9220/g.19881  ORF Transcript_9220/g.19881 Transcript_9220/m.19881 type:complete len:94 (+) Transcript_9220:119-400(+)|eukprot:CAMPEP_0168723812 /NCGR_PEP_ID=MMETSP0724-20121128/3311_1 /TAXON_ID=265536 /ORGANISM="Amphiprora sp., Strain CCMP467" /LENGTH=93 /DNA_ID=CAMNT_0008770537 /DNA_START=82 /DNA_END=363 /DNA_ORIENTATION=+